MILATSALAASARTKNRHAVCNDVAASAVIHIHDVAASAGIMILATSALAASAVIKATIAAMTLASNAAAASTRGVEAPSDCM
jgi:hypothetical protein